MTMKMMLVLVSIFVGVKPTLCCSYSMIWMIGRKMKSSLMNSSMKRFDVMTMTMMVAMVVMMRMATAIVVQKAMRLREKEKEDAFFEVMGTKRMLKKWRMMMMMESERCEDWKRMAVVESGDQWQKCLGGHCKRGEEVKGEDEKRRWKEFQDSHDVSHCLSSLHCQ